MYSRGMGRAVEAAGDVEVLLLDKTKIITLGNRQAADPGNEVCSCGSSLALHGAAVGSFCDSAITSFACTPGSTEGHTLAMRPSLPMRNDTRS